MGQNQNKQKKRKAAGNPVKKSRLAGCLSHGWTSTTGERASKSQRLRLLGPCHSTPLGHPEGRPKWNGEGTSLLFWRRHVPQNAQHGFSPFCPFLGHSSSFNTGEKSHAMTQRCSVMPCTAKETRASFLSAKVKLLQATAGPKGSTNVLRHI